MPRGGKRSGAGRPKKYQLGYWDEALIFEHYRALRRRYYQFTAYMDMKNSYYGSEDQDGVGLLQIYSVPARLEFRGENAREFMHQESDLYIKRVYEYYANSQARALDLYDEKTWPPRVDNYCDENCACEVLSRPHIVDGMVVLNLKGKKLQNKHEGYFNTIPLFDLVEKGLCKMNKVSLCEVIAEGIEALSNRKMLISSVRREQGKVLHTGKPIYDGVGEKLEEKAIRHIKRKYGIEMSRSVFRSKRALDSGRRKEHNDILDSERIAEQRPPAKMVYARIVETGDSKVHDGKGGFISVGEVIEIDIASENNLIKRGYAELVDT